MSAPVSPRPAANRGVPRLQDGVQIQFMVPRDLYERIAAGAAADFSTVPAFIRRFILLNLDTLAPRQGTSDATQ